MYIKIIIVYNNNEIPKKRTRRTNVLTNDCFREQVFWRTNVLANKCLRCKSLPITTEPWKNGANL